MSGNRPIMGMVGRTPPVDDSLDWRRTPPAKCHGSQQWRNGDPKTEVLSTMTTPSDDNLTITFSQGTKASFLQYLRENPSNRRVSLNEREILIEWLTNPYRRPSSQKEFSRRNYVRKTFAWDERTQNLIAVAKKREDRDRIVVTEDRIADTLEVVHERNNHAGWDATWKDVSASYYGILRSDVIFLLRHCQICAHNPSKRPKSSRGSLTNSGTTNHELLDFLDLRELDDGNVIQSVSEDGNSSRE